MINLSVMERLLCRVLDRRVSGYVGNAQHATTHFCRQLNCAEHKRHTIYNGIDHARFSHPRPSREVRSESGLPELARCLITVANMHHPQKGHDDLIQAWIRVAHTRPSDHLVLVGTGNRMAALQAHIQRAGLEGRTHFLGMRRDVPDLLAACDLYVSPSWVEGFSNAIAEAILCGLPVVATRVGGTPEMVEPGEYGSLVEPRQIDELAVALAKEYPRRTQENIRRFADRVSLERLGGEYLKMYELSLKG